MQDTAMPDITVNWLRLEKRDDAGVLFEVCLYDGATDILKTLRPGDAGFLPED